MGNGELTAAQRAALDHVRARASQQQGAARARILELLRAAHVNQAACDDAIASVRDHARVVIHFHPDRLDVRLRSVADALLEDGVYRNQFDTGLSTGGLLPFVGSARDRWERELFGGLGNHAEVLQYLKQLWHALVHCS